MGRIQYREVLGTEHTKRRQLELGTRTQEEEPALEKGKRKEKKKLLQFYVVVQVSVWGS